MNFNFEKFKTFSVGISSPLTLLIFTIFFFLISCRQTKNESNQYSWKSNRIEKPVDFDLAKIIERGKLIAILDNSSTSYYIYKGRPMGYEYELLKKLCKQLDVKLEIIVTADIDEAFYKLNLGEADIIAYNLTVTRQRMDLAAFTQPLGLERQVLVQRLPENWRTQKQHEIESQLIRNPLDLAGKEITVRKASAFVDRLVNLSDEIGGEIVIVEDFEDVETETLIKKVAEGEIQYTVADENIARLLTYYYSNIDIGTVISFPQKKAWAVRKNAPELLEAVDEWLENIKKGPELNMLYNKYFNNVQNAQLRLRAQLRHGVLQVSPYDDLLKSAAKELGWDWRLLAAQAYQESRFDANAESWAGAVGIMQLIPSTAELYGASDPYNPKQSIEAGTRYLKWLDNFWKDKVPDDEERIKFVLASYNVGQGHVLDAYRLAEKYNKDPQKWEDNVEYFVQQKSYSQYYNDSVVKSGYCRGTEPVNYVKNIMERYHLYKVKINS